MQMTKLKIVPVTDVSSHKTGHVVDQITLDWAQDRLAGEVQSFADDPAGYCGDEFLPLEAWARLVHIANELGLDAMMILQVTCTPFEITRVSRLTQRDFG
jgi:hypothetical protein